MRPKLATVVVRVAAAFVLAATALAPASCGHYVLELPPLPEVCENGADDDNDGDIDCDDLDCVNDAACEIDLVPFEGEGVAGEGEGVGGEGEGVVGEGEGVVGEGEGVAGEGEGEGDLVATEVEPNGAPPTDVNAFVDPYVGHIDAADRDCVSFDLVAHERFIATTSAPTADASGCDGDSVVQWLDVDGTTELGRNDDGSGLGLCSRFSGAPLAGGTYFLCVTALNGTDAFDFRLSIARPPPSCGNGVREAGEGCDNSDIGETCLSLGLGSGGSVSCDGLCNIDTSLCPPPVCGNGAAEAAEQCDGFDFRDDTCVARGFGNGNLTCIGAGSIGECTIDETSCPLRCSDNAIESGEECDDGNTVDGDLCSSACLLEQTPFAEVEPNDDGTPQTGASDFAAASAMGPFTSDVIITGALSPDGDEDALAIANTGGVDISVRARTFAPTFLSCDNADTTLEVRDGGGGLLAVNDDAFFRCSDLTFVVPAFSTLFLVVADFADDGSIPAYQVFVDFP